jgi:hypothetical protein
MLEKHSTNHMDDEIHVFFHWMAYAILFFSCPKQTYKTHMKGHKQFQNYLYMFENNG